MHCLSPSSGIMQQFAISEATLFGWNSMDGESMGAGSNQGSVAHLSEVNQESITSRGQWITRRPIWWLGLAFILSHCSVAASHSTVTRLTSCCCIFPEMIVFCYWTDYNSSSTRTYSRSRTSTWMLHRDYNYCCCGPRWSFSSSAEGETHRRGSWL